MLGKSERLLRSQTSSQHSDSDFLSSIILIPPLCRSGAAPVAVSSSFSGPVFIPWGMGVEEVGHAPHSSLWRQGVWIGLLCSTWRRGRSYILTNYREETSIERQREGEAGTVAAGKMYSWRYWKVWGAYYEGETRTWRAIRGCQCSTVAAESPKYKLQYAFVCICSWTFSF